MLKGSRHLRIRITRKPEGVVDGIELGRFTAGRVYDVGASLATYLTSAGWAEPVVDDPHPTNPHRRWRLTGYRVLALDYDNTLAMGGQIADDVIAALRQLRSSGRIAVLATGRELDDLLAVCPEIDLFERVVAENGAVLYDPGTAVTRLLTAPPPPEFSEFLRAKGIPFSAGRVVIGTNVSFAPAVIEAIRALELRLQVVYNREELMVLPSGINKASGLGAALEELGREFAQVVAVGDAENDDSLLRVCGYRAAVANAVPSLKAIADLVTRHEGGRGVVEVVEALLGAR